MLNYPLWFTNAPSHRSYGIFTEIYENFLGFVCEKINYLIDFGGAKWE